MPYVGKNPYRSYATGQLMPGAYAPPPPTQQLAPAQGPPQPSINDNAMVVARSGSILKNLMKLRSQYADSVPDEHVINQMATKIMGGPNHVAADYLTAVANIQNIIGRIPDGQGGYTTAPIPRLPNPNAATQQQDISGNQQAEANVLQNRGLRSQYAPAFNAGQPPSPVTSPLHPAQFLRSLGLVQ